MRSGRLLKQIAAAAMIAVCSFSANAHESTHTWALSATDIQDLQAHLEQNRAQLESALNEAASVGISTDELTRPYAFDSNSSAAKIPRSVLNRVMLASLEIEVAQMKLTAFCGPACDHRADAAQRSVLAATVDAKSMGIAKKLWSYAERSFRLFWHDIPVGVWQRAIHAAAYTRALKAAGLYQSKAYGPLAMLAGGTAFGVSFALTELAEGPFHLICQANYIWSIAFGTAVASFARDLRAVLGFASERKSLSRRALEAASTFRSILKLRKLEKRVFFHALTGEPSEVRKITRRDSYTGELSRALGERSWSSAIAADQLLWAELLTQTGQASPRAKLFTTRRERLFAEETERVFAASGELVWMDLHASLRTLLRALRLEVETAYIGKLSGANGEILKTLGSLDRELRTLDLFVLQSLARSASQKSPTWLQQVVTEWLSLALAVTSDSADTSVIDARMRRLRETIEAAVRRGGMVEGDHRLSEQPLVSGRRPMVRLCQSIFRVQ